MEMADLIQMTPAEVLASLTEGKRTYGSIGDAAVKVQRYCTNNHAAAAEVARLVFEGYVADLEANFKEGPISHDEAIRIAKSNIGYLCGYYDAKVAEFWYDAIDTSHPIFGASIAVGPETAFAAGEAAGRTLKDGGTIEDATTAAKDVVAAAPPTG